VSSTAAELCHGNVPKAAENETSLVSYHGVRRPASHCHATTEQVRGGEHGQLLGHLRLHPVPRADQPFLRSAWLHAPVRVLLFWLVCFPNPFTVASHLHSPHYFGWCRLSGILVLVSACVCSVDILFEDCVHLQFVDFAKECVCACVRACVVIRFYDEKFPFFRDLLLNHGDNIFGSIANLVHVASNSLSNSLSNSFSKFFSTRFSYVGRLNSISHSLL
jgi:hypothetical protein